MRLGDLFRLKQLTGPAVFLSPAYVQETPQSLSSQGQSKRPEYLPFYQEHHQWVSTFRLGTCFLTIDPAHREADRCFGVRGTQSVSVLVAQSCLTLCNPMDCSLPGSSVHGILQARILEWVAMPFSTGSSQPRDQTQGWGGQDALSSITPFIPLLHWDRQSSCAQVGASVQAIRFA